MDSELRRRCEDECDWKSVSAIQRHFGLGYSKAAEIQEALLQKEMEIEKWQLKYHIEVDADRIAEIKSLQTEIERLRSSHPMECFGCKQASDENVFLKQELEKGDRYKNGLSLKIVNLQEKLAVAREALQRMADGDVGQGGYEKVYSPFAKQALQQIG